LGGGTIQDQNEKQRIEHTINEVVLDRFPYETYINKLGSSYLVVIYIEPKTENINVMEFKMIQKKIKVNLQKYYPTLLVELSLK